MSRIFNHILYLPTTGLFLDEWAFLSTDYKNHVKQSADSWSSGVACDKFQFEKASGSFFISPLSGKFLHEIIRSERNWRAMATFGEHISNNSAAAILLN